MIALPVLAPEANGTERKGEFTLAADGTLAGSIDTFHSGPEGADLRTFLKYTDEKERRAYWETHIAHDLPGVVLELVPVRGGLKPFLALRLFQHSLFQLFLALDAVPRPRNSLQPLGIDLLAARDAFPEAALPHPLQRALHHLQQLAVVVALMKRNSLV